MLHTHLATRLFFRVSPLIMCLILSVLASLAEAQTMPPAVGTASAPAAAAASAAPVPLAPANYSTPVEAAKSLVRASFAKDMAAVRDALMIPTGRADVEAMLDAMEASWQLQEAAKVRFKAAGEKAFENGGPTEAEQLKNLDLATLEEKGTMATLTLPAASEPAGAAAVAGKKVVLTKTAGGWKTDAVGLFDLDGKGAAGRVELAKKVAGIAREVAKEIKSGKLTSATVAYQEFWRRSQAVTTGPATASGLGTRP